MKPYKLKIEIGDAPPDPWDEEPYDEDDVEDDVEGDEDLDFAPIQDGL